MKTGLGIVVAMAALVGCGGSTGGGSTSTGGASSGGTSTGGASSGGTSTSGGSGGSAGSVTGGSGGGAPLPGQTLAIKRVFLGETDFNSIPDPDAWKKYGVNLDGLTSTAADTAHCNYQMGATKSTVQTDGDNGIDNSWGRNLMPIMASLSANPSDSVSESILAGGATLLLHVQKLGTEPDQTGLAAALYVAAPFGGQPAWNGSDARLATFDSVGPAGLSQPLTSFPNSNVSGGVFNAAPPTTMPLPLGGELFLFGNLRVHHARLFTTITGSGSTAKATGGIIAGVLDTEEFVVELKKVAGGFDPTLCEGATFDSIAQQIRAASDIMKDGTNGDPSKTCDGISLGIGFEATAVTLNGVAQQQPPSPDPCK